MPEHKTDLRVTKTRAAIQTAFQQMICEMDAWQITIKELTQRAFIHRKTFYLHYSSIEALYEEQTIIDSFLLRTSVTLYRQWVADGKTLPLDRLIALSGTLLMNGIASIPRV